MIEVLFFSIALADKYNQLAADRKKEREKRFELEKTFSTSLKQEVDVRTYELVQKNEYLEQLTLQYQESQKQLKALIDSNRDLYATLTHQLRTPLTVIKSFVSFLLRGKKCQLPTAEQRAHLELVQGNVIGLEMVTSEIFEVLSVDNKFKTRSEQQKIEDLPGTLLSILRNYRDLFGENLFFEQDHKEYAEVAGSPKNLEYILDNFLLNAYRHAPGKPVKVKVIQKSVGVKIIVADHGDGIPEEFHDKIFQRFFRMKRDEATTGSGVGLYIASQMAEEMNAQIGIDSHVGQGSEFWVLLKWRTNENDR
ncbi:MAG: HAMP domain-containing histidine kinase [SAR324 cluster bacterium]|nr:HAMP domain-containing histidine kinase [SAR324 cluster bacterium]